MTSLRGHAVALSLLAAISCTGAAPDDRGTARSASPVPSKGLDGEVRFEPFPGSRWYGPDGAALPDDNDVVNAITGPDHCEWQSAVMLHLRWPPRPSSPLRQYLRDPEGVFARESLRSRYDGDTTLPESARSSGYRTDFMELWLSPDVPEAAFLVFADHVERWPRAREQIACA